MKFSVFQNQEAGHERFNSISSCELGECQDCPGCIKIKDNVTRSFDHDDVEEIKFETCLQTDRCTLKTLVMNSDFFVHELCEGLLKLRIHDLIAKEQS